jgi:predicted transcriptional regulator
VDSTSGQTATVLTAACFEAPDRSNRPVVMYTTYIMRRTQIYLTLEQGTRLEHQSRATGRTISELIRAAIDASLARPQSAGRADRATLARSTAGAWAPTSETSAEYVDRVRSKERLSRLTRER